MISPARLAWLQLRRQKIRLAVAIAGVTFAVILIMMQVGFQDALYRSAVNFHRRLQADVVLIHPHYNFLAHPTTFSRRRLYQALGFPGVVSVRAVYTGPVRWKNPATGRTRDIFAVGVDPAVEVLDIPGVNAHRAQIRYPDVVLFDEMSRPEYGPIADLVRAGQEVVTEASQRQVTVGGTFRLGTSFGIDGTLVTSDLNFLRIFPSHAPGAISIGLIRLEPGADARAVRTALSAALPRDVDVLTKQEFMDREVRYWATATPIGYVFTFGVIMSLVVGAIIVYQILFADIADHLAEYATLKAIGYTNRYLVGVVMMEALILAVAGFVPGLGICWRLYGLTAAATHLPLAISAGRGLFVLVLTVVMCWTSAIIAIRKLRAVDPAEVF